MNQETLRERRAVIRMLEHKKDKMKFGEKRHLTGGETTAVVTVIDELITKLKLGVHNPPDTPPQKGKKTWLMRSPEPLMNAMAEMVRAGHFKSRNALVNHVVENFLDHERYGIDWPLLPWQREVKKKYSENHEITVDELIKWFRSHYRGYQPDGVDLNYELISNQELEKKRREEKQSSRRNR